MKNICFLLIASILSIALMAQENSSEPLTNKKGIPLHPQKGDWAIGIDATPFFQYFGNFYAADNNNTPEFGFTANNPGAIYAKYVLSSKTKIRGILHIGITSETEKETNFSDPDNPHKRNTSGVSFGLTAGLEKTKNIYGRFAGIYGAQIYLMLSPYDGSGRISYKDANDSDNDWVEKGGRTSSIGVGGFIGVEFYIAPKVSLSGEFCLDIGGSVTGDRILKPVRGNETTIELGGSSFSFAPAASGDLVILFYF